MKFLYNLFIFMLLITSLDAKVSNHGKGKDNKDKSINNFKMDLPVKCKMNEDCFIQNYFDVNQKTPDQPYRDYTCGHLSFPEHTGTDFRVKTYADMQRGVNVTAVASGKVYKVTDGEDDSPSIERGDILPIKYCGNGVAIRHKGNWITRYCHLKKDSIKVRIGQSVKRGEIIGQIGMTGMAQFPHVHITVISPARKLVDPFTGMPPSPKNKCKKSNLGKIPKGSLWSAKAIKELGEIKRTAVLSGGVSVNKVTKKEALLKASWDNNLKSDDPRVLFWVKLFGVKKGDVEIFKIWDPNGRLFLAAKKRPIYKDKAVWLSVVGRKKPINKVWEAGNYKAEYILLRDDKIVVKLDKNFKITNAKHTYMVKNNIKQFTR